MTVDIRLLGPVQVTFARRTIRLGGLRQRTLFGLLALRAPEVVSRDALIEGIWDTQPPANAGKTLRAHIAHLRQCLSAGGAVDLIETKAPGYALAVPAERVDVHWFEDLVRLGRSAAAGGAMETAVDHLRTSLRLWRGEALSDCSTGQWAQAEVTRLQEVRLFATEDLLAAELALGHHARVAAELASLVTCHPLRERMWELLMLALYHAGRPADALYAYRRARSTIVDELGLEPGPRLRKLELAILTGVGA